EWVENAGVGRSILTVIDEHDGDYQQQIRFHTGGLGIERLEAGVYRVEGHVRDSIFVFSPRIEFEIASDVCGFTHCISAKIPEQNRQFVTRVLTASKSDILDFYQGSGEKSDQWAVGSG
ncbi:MAG: hypothetical protein GX804_09060, partial [Lentisphaerae bacterium]|nr:hypothetical protein [Lentisphaerota bacterium]